MPVFFSETSRNFPAYLPLLFTELKSLFNFFLNGEKNPVTLLVKTALCNLFCGSREYFVLLVGRTNLSTLNLQIKKRKCYRGTNYLTTQLHISCIN